MNRLTVLIESKLYDMILLILTKKVIVITMIQIGLILFFNLND